MRSEFHRWRNSGIRRWQNSKDRGGIVRTNKVCQLSTLEQRYHGKGKKLSQVLASGVLKSQRTATKFAVQSTFSGSFSDPLGTADDAGFWAPKIGLRRCSCSRALTALRRSRNQVFSGQLQLPSTSE